MTKAIDFIHRVVKVLIVLIFAFMVLSTFANAVGRYAFFTSFPWVDESSSITLVWLSFLAIFAGLHENVHPSFNVLVTKLGPRPRKVLMTLINLCIFVFLAFVTVGGYQYMLRASVQKTAILMISYSWIYAAVPVTGVLMAIEVIIQTVKMWLAPDKN